MAPFYTRKHSDSKVAELASALTSKWKEVVKARAGGGGDTTPSASKPDAPRAEEKKGKGAPEPKKEKPAVPKVETPKAGAKAVSRVSVEERRRGKGSGDGLGQEARCLEDWLK